MSYPQRLIVNSKLDILLLLFQISYAALRNNNIYSNFCIWWNSKVGVRCSREVHFLFFRSSMWSLSFRNVKYKANDKGVATGFISNLLQFKRYDIKCGKM